MRHSLSAIRTNYQLRNLCISDFSSNPIESFRAWLDEAIEFPCLEPTAMVLSTVSSAGRPSGRVVLLKEMEDDGSFVFFTNYASRKGSELACNNWASLTFFWSEIERQVRIGGKVERIARAASEQYFYSRPFDSQIAAIISPQSQLIPNRLFLDARFQELKQESSAVLCPEHWGGYRLIPDEIEFWQGGANRLHDRILFECRNGKWFKCRLSP